MGEIEVGVSQGSCFGPLLSLVCIKDLPKVTQGKVSMYADNTNLCFMSNDISKLETAVTSLGWVGPSGLGMLKRANYRLLGVSLKTLQSSIVKPYFQHCCSV